MKIAAENWRVHGNILGTNEIMGLMFRRDLVVLGISDGVMCGATGFGLALQKLIAQGFLSWNKQGWILQSVSLLWKQNMLLPFNHHPCCHSHVEDPADNCFPGVGTALHCWRPVLDSVSRMAVDTYSFLCVTWYRNAHEAA